MSRPAEVRLPSSPGDEVGTPDSSIEYCEGHDVLYRVGGNCLVCEREEVA